MSQDTNQTTDNERPVCPECETTNIYHRRPKGATYKTPHPTDYHCLECSHDFDEPATKRVRNAGVVNTGLAAKLEKADAEEVSR